jgi:uncharacterized membrane protein YhhN
MFAIFAAVALVVIGLLVAEFYQNLHRRLILKPVASLGFVVLGFLGQHSSLYDQLILFGLLTGFLGDVLLLGRNRKWFLAGLLSFLIGHLAYTTAFLTLETPLRFPLLITAIMSFGGVWVLQAFRAKLEGYYKPVIVYSLVIAAMVVVSSRAPILTFLGAIAFAISDVFVLRERFGEREFVNKLFGLPLYYLAQCLIALSLT